MYVALVSWGGPSRYHRLIGMGETPSPHKPPLVEQAWPGNVPHCFMGLVPSGLGKLG